jgi:hypothetical protein
MEIYMYQLNATNEPMMPMTANEISQVSGGLEKEGLFPRQSGWVLNDT